MSSRKTRDSWMHGWQSSKQRISGFVSHPYTDKNGKLTADGGTRNGIYASPPHKRGSP